MLFENLHRAILFNEGVWWLCFLRLEDKVMRESRGRSEGALKGVVRAAFLEDGKGSGMVDGDIVHKGVIAARQMQPLVVSSAVTAHLVPAPSVVSQEIYLNILFALKGV